MEDRRQRNGRMSVPQFGSWENQGGSNPADGYTMVFTKARANRKEQKTKTVPSHIANAYVNNTLPEPHHNHLRRRHNPRNHHHRVPEQRLGQDEAAGKKNILAYLNCCIRP